jgi:hypothetical protein
MHVTLILRILSADGIIMEQYHCLIMGMQTVFLSPSWIKSLIKIEKCEPCFQGMPFDCFRATISVTCFHLNIVCVTVTFVHFNRKENVIVETWRAEHSVYWLVTWSTSLWQAPGKWEDVRVIVERTDPIDRNGPCANSLPQDDIKQDSLPAGKLSKKGSYLKQLF